MHYFLKIIIKYSYEFQFSDVLWMSNKFVYWIIKWYQTMNNLDIKWTKSDLVLNCVFICMPVKTAAKNTLFKYIMQKYVQLCMSVHFTTMRNVKQQGFPQKRRGKILSNSIKFNSKYKLFQQMKKCRFYKWRVLKYLLRMNSSDFVDFRAIWN